MIDFLQGDCLDVLKTLPDCSVQCCITSPPYWGLRDYGHEKQLGSEPTHQQFVANLAAVFAQVHRVLKDDGTLWLNLGDSYSSQAGQRKTTDNVGMKQHTNIGSSTAPSRNVPELGPKQLIGIPWRVAFALQADGWYLRSDIIWAKPNPMPESVTDRPTKSHEYIFLLTKAAKYYYDQSAIVEPVSHGTHMRLSQNLAAQIGSERANGGAKTNGNMKAVGKASWHGSRFDSGKTADHQLGRSQKRQKVAATGSGIKNNDSFNDACCLPVEHRNKRTVWTVPTFSYSGAHFATFPPKLIEPCILAGSRPGDTILDPFGGSGTVGLVALEHGRKAILIELNPEYIKLAQQRCETTVGLGLT